MSAYPSFLSGEGTLTAFPPEPLIEEFCRRIFASGRRAQDLASIWATFAEVAPHWAEASDGRTRLRNALEQGAILQLLRLPRGKDGWDKVGVPSLPLWVRPSPEASPSPPAEIYSWLAPMGWATKPGWRKRADKLRLLNEWLKRHRTCLPPAVPLRERSLEIFGDEKFLEANLDVESGTAFAGNLRFEDIATFVVPPPIAHRSVENSRTSAVLVVENLDSYTSFSKWNQDNRHFRAVAWGGGNAFGRTCLSVEGEVGAADPILYLGDLDPAGVGIPHFASAKRVRQNLSPVVPALGLYRWLLRWGTERKLASPPTQADRAALAWLSASCGGSDVALSLSSLWDDCGWFPQEGLGTAALAGRHPGAAELAAALVNAGLP